MLAVALALSVSAPLLGRAAIEECIPIASVPFVVSAPGEYCLASDLTHAGETPAITIAADDVVLDLAGFTLAGTSGPGAASQGIFAWGRRRVTVRNGTLTGFRLGLYFGGANAQDYAVENLRVAQSWYIGIRVRSASARVQSCRVSQTGGSTVPDDTIPIGISVIGDDVQAVDNVVIDTQPPPGGEAIGISIGPGSGATVARNVISNGTSWLSSWGIWMNAPVDQAVVTDNFICRYATGLAFPSFTSGEYRANTFMNVTQAVSRPSDFRAVDGGDNRSFVAFCDPIYELPWTITASGSYCLVRNLSVSAGDAITIEADDVTLDLKGFKLGGGAAGSGTEANGVHARDRSNITVRHGNIRGFFRAVFLEDTSGSFVSSEGHVVEAIRADENTHAGIHVQGRGNIVRGCQVMSTTGTTVFGDDAETFGIRAEGPDTRILGNDVTDTVGMGTAAGTGIALTASPAAVVDGNRIGNDAVANSYGVRIVSGDDILVVNNRVSRTTFGVVYERATGRFRRNLTSGTLAPYVGGTDVGKNQ
jgi:hypothetical protein